MELELKYRSNENESTRGSHSDSTDPKKQNNCFTVEEAVNAIGFGVFQIKLTCLLGLHWLSEAMIMMIISVVSPALNCSWGISDLQQAIITTVYFVGQALTSNFWGVIADKFGRKKSLVLGTIIIFHYGLLNAFAPNFYWMLILRGFVGIGMGCEPQIVTLLIEFLPIKSRGKCIILMATFWTIGACGEVVLAMYVIPTLGWRWLLGLTVIPMLLFLLLSTWLPESARYDVGKGNMENAFDTLKRIAAANGTSMPAGKLVANTIENEKRGRITDLFNAELRLTTFLLLIIWFVAAFAYYGNVLINTELLQMRNRCEYDFEDMPKYCHANCPVLRRRDYLDMLWATAAELPSLLIATPVVDCLGRKKTTCLSFLIYTAFAFALFDCTLDRNLLIFVLIGARVGIEAVWDTMYAYTPEVYPTTLRATGIGACKTMSCVGSVVTPFVAQVLIKISPKLTFGIYGGLGAISTLATILLPVETKDRELQEAQK